MQAIDNDNEYSGCLQTFFIIVVFTLLIVIPSAACILRNEVNAPPGLIIGKSQPVEIIQAKADAATQATNDKIKLEWNQHFMFHRTFDKFILVSSVYFLTLIIIGLFVWGWWRYGRK